MTNVPKPTTAKRYFLNATGFNIRSVISIWDENAIDRAISNTSSGLLTIKFTKGTRNSQMLSHHPFRKQELFIFFNENSNRMILIKSAKNCKTNGFPLIIYPNTPRKSKKPNKK